MHDIQVLKAELDSLRSRVEEEAAARRRDSMAPLDPVAPNNRFPERSGFQVYRYGAGGFDKVIVTAGKVITRAGVTSYAQKTFTITENCELFARYEIATSGGGAAWEVVSSHVIQQAASLPAFSAAFILVPIATIGWNATDSRVSTITVHHTGTLRHIELPAGIISYWNGSIATIPNGWAHHTTLNDKFLVGAGGEYAVDDTGGDKEHSHNIPETIPKSHTHGTTEVEAGSGSTVMSYHDACDPRLDNALYCGDTDAGDTHWTFTVEDSDGRPPYTAKAIIIKL